MAKEHSEQLPDEDSTLSEEENTEGSNAKQTLDQPDRRKAGIVTLYDNNVKGNNTVYRIFYDEDLNVIGHEKKIASEDKKQKKKS